jgi:hypothetical protein
MGVALPSLTNVAETQIMEAQLLSFVLLLLASFSHLGRVVTVSYGQDQTPSCPCDTKNTRPTLPRRDKLVSSKRTRHAGGQQE